MSKIRNDGLTLWLRMLYSCTHMAALGVKGLTGIFKMCCAPNLKVLKTRHRLCRDDLQ